MKVLICHASNDAGPATDLVADVVRGGGEVFSVTAAVGDNPAYWEEALEAVRGCELFVCALSPDLLRSVATMRMLDYAVALDRPLLPVLLRDVPLEFAPPAVAKTQFVDYRGRTVEGAIALATALTRRTLVPPLPDPLPPPPRPPSVEENASASAEGDRFEPAVIPHATLLIVLSIVGLLTAPLPIISVPVFVIARQKLRRLDQSGRTYLNRDLVVWARRIAFVGIIWCSILIVAFGLLLLILKIFYA